MDSSKLKMLKMVVKGMLEEAKKSENSKKAGIDLKADLKNVINDGTPKKVVQSIMAVNKAKVDSIKEMLNSDEAAFIKEALTGSDKYKEISEKIEAVGDMIPEGVKLEYWGYKYWCMNWFSIAKMGLTAPVPVIGGILKYQWIFDLLKSNNALATAGTAGRKGANVIAIHKLYHTIINDVCDLVKFNLQYPDQTVLKQAMVPPEILIAMDLHYFLPELQGTVLPKCDQFAGLRYLDATADIGLPQDTCSYPRFAQGVALLDEMIPGSCMIASNLPCDGGMSCFEIIQQRMNNIPTYRINIPYDFRNEKSNEIIADDLRGMIAFLEEHTGHKMDYDKLREVCKEYNEMMDVEYERWEIIKMDNPPFSGDALWYPHEWCFNLGSGRKDMTQFLKAQLEINKKALRKGQKAFPTMRYRTIVWAVPPAYYGSMWGWMENCWGVGSVMDLETYGAMEYIDTTSTDTMLKGLGRRYMWGTMAKHTRGPAENFLGDLDKVIVDFRPDFVYYPAHLGCKNSMSLTSEMKDVCKKHGIGLCVVRYELLDNRIADRQALRDGFSKFMTEVMHAEPLDSSLLKIDDVDPGKW